MSDSQEEAVPTPPVRVPASVLSAEALEGIVEHYILREGTDYGTQEASFDAKRAQVRRQIEREEIVVVFDPDSESVTLMTALEWRRTQGAPAPDSAETA